MRGKRPSVEVESERPVYSAGAVRHGAQKTLRSASVGPMSKAPGQGLRRRALGLAHQRPAVATQFTRILCSVSRRDQSSIRPRR